MDAVAFVARQGIVLASAKGSVPSLAEWVSGESIRGSWWGHPRGREIFAALNAVADSADVLSFRLIEGKITFVHRRLWPALVRLADTIGRARLAAIRQEHTARGAHRNVVTPFPRWVPEDVREAATRLTETDARAQVTAAAASILK
jgi:hypothetical protein